MNSVFTMKRSMLLFPATLAILCLIAVAIPNTSGAVTCKLKGSKKVSCPTGQLQGPAGPAGPAGPQGPQGAPGGTPAGSAAVQKFSFLAIGNTPNTTIQTFTGAVAESGCTSAGPAFTGPRLRGTAENGAAEVLNLRLNSFSFDPDLDTGQTVDLLAGGGADDQYGLTYMAANGAQEVSAHYSAYVGPGIAGQYDCAIFGTSEIGG